MIGIFAKLFRPRTVVYLRSFRTPVQHWTSVVLYDAWGTPYVAGSGGRAEYGGKTLFPNGHTSDHLYETEWRHKSGPPITFGKRPSGPFGETPS